MAATIVDDLMTKYGLDASGYASGAQQVARAGASMHQSLSGTERDFAGLWSTMQAGLHAASVFIKAVGAAELALAGLGVMAMKKAADMDALILSLTAVEGSATKAASILEKIKGLAKGPGLGFAQSIQGWVQLRMNEVSPALTEKLLREVGNAVALSGGGKDAFGRVLLAMSQIAASPVLLGQDMRQLMEAGLPVRKVFKDKYGTSDPEELAKLGVSSAQALEDLADGFAKLGRAGNGAKNAMENMADTMDRAIMGIGMGLNKNLMPFVDQFSDAVANLTDQGFFDTLGDTLGGIASGFADALTQGRDMEDFLMDMGGNLVTVAAAMRNFNLNLMEMFDLWQKNTPLGWLFNKLSGSDISPQQEGQNFRDEFELQKQLRESRAKHKKNPGGWVTDMFNDTKAGMQQKQLERLDQIAVNTGRAVELQRMALGGGDIGAQGASAVEVHGLRRGTPSSRPRGRRDTAASLESAVTEIIHREFRGLVQNA